MNLESLMPKVPQEKTASAAPATPAAGTSSVAKAAVAQALDAVKTVKTASAENPVSHLRKMANEIAQSDMEKVEKLALFLGQTMADGYAQRLAAYEKVATEITEKNASAVSAEDIALAKFAKEHPAQFMAEIQKAAAAQQDPQAEVKQAAEDMEQRIFELSSDHFLAGYEVGRAMGTPA